MLELPISHAVCESARHEDAQKRLISATAAAQKRRAEVLPDLGSAHSTPCASCALLS